MKKYAILTSVLALAACGGGSGGGMPVVPGEVSVSKSNRAVTALPTRIDNRSEIVAYVESKLGSDYYDYSDSDVSSSDVTAARSGSARAKTRTLTLEEKYKQACAKLDAMNDTFKKMQDASNVADFITENEARVIEALKLAGIDVPDAVTKENVEEIVTAFEEQDKEALLKEVNDKTKLKEQTIEDITFNSIGAGDDVVEPFMLKLDEEGKISSVLYPGDEEDDGSIMERVGNTTKFKRVAYSYSFNGPDGIEVRVETSEELSLDEMKARLKGEVKKKFADHSKKDDALAVIEAFTENSQVYDRKDKNGFLVVKHTENVDFQTRGKDLGMQYADFGFMRGTVQTVIGKESDQEEYIEAFAGGYGDKRIDSSRMSDIDNMTFKGQAVGGVSYVLDTLDENGEEKSVSGSKFLEDKNATLVFNKGTETLNMNFANSGWYNVTVTSKDGISDIKFDGNVSDKNYAFINTDVKGFTSEPVQGVEGSQYSGSFKTDYYGDNEKNPHDATAVVGFVEESHTKDPDNQWDHQIGFGAAFGGVKQ